MLETLFAAQGQADAFLALAAGGLILGAMLHLGTCLRGRHPILSGATDLFTALLFCLMLLHTMLRYQGGLRLCGLLGVLLGMVLYLAGVGRILQKCSEFIRHKQEKASCAEKQTGTHDESR